MYNEFLTYGPNREYATLDAYKLPMMIVTKDKKFYDCKNYFINHSTKPVLNELLNYSQPYLNHHIPGSISEYRNTAAVTIVYANYYLAPWYKTIEEDELYYRLCDYNRFLNVQPYYFGTNYGRLWSTVSGSYIAAHNNRPNKDGNGYQHFRVLTVERNEDNQYKIRNIAGHWISAYFVINPKPSEYNTICHKDNNPRNNYYKNLYWGTQKQNIEQAIADNRVNISISKMEIEELIRKRNDALLNGTSFNDIKYMIKDYAKEHNVTETTIYNLIRGYGLKSSMIPYNVHTSSVCTDALPINECLYLNDYNPTYTYAKLDSLKRPDIIITCTGKVYRIKNKNDIIKYFPEDRNKWPSLNDLENLDGIIQSCVDSKRPVIRNIYNEYTKVQVSTVELISNCYFGEAPWYLKYGRQENIDFVQICKHSQLKDIYPYYFLCNNGKVFNIATGEYVSCYYDKHRLPSYSLTRYTSENSNNHSLMKSVPNLLKMFNFIKN